ncbi:MAG: hypothetical protein KTR14_00040 [Vampirovibrio sp.]|nr:hypothetical protein [Vampirovibrio sp.]
MATPIGPGIGIPPGAGLAPQQPQFLRSALYQQQLAFTDPRLYNLAFGNGLNAVAGGFSSLGIGGFPGASNPLEMNSALAALDANPIFGRLVGLGTQLSPEAQSKFAQAQQAQQQQALFGGLGAGFGLQGGLGAGGLGAGGFGGLNPAAAQQNPLGMMLQLFQGLVGMLSQMGGQ